MSSQEKGRPSGDVGVLRAAGAMGVAVMISRVLGLVREQVFAFMFGAGHAMDAFNIAFKIPNLLRNLFAEGAMSAAFVPTFIRVRENEGERRAWRLAGLVFRALLAASGVTALIGILAAPLLVDLLAGAYREVGGKFELTVLLTQVMWVFLPLVALAAAYMGLLNSCGKYFLPALSSALFNAVSIVTGAALAWVSPNFGLQPIVGMAVGVVLGGAVQAFCQLPLVYKVGYRWPERAPEDPPWPREDGLRQMLMMMGPATLGLAATQINTVVNAILASGAGAGAVSWLNYAFRLMQLPIGVFGVSLASALLPAVSTLWVRKDFDGISQSLEKTLRQVIAINLPASAGLAFLAVPIIELIFEYGRFGDRDTLATATALAAYAGGLVFYSIVKILVPAFYAMGNTRVPVLSSTLSVVLNVILNIALIGPLGYWGLALGTSLAALLNSAFLVAALNGVMRKTGRGFSPSVLMRPLLVHGILSVVMGVACLWSHELLAAWISDAALAGGLGPLGVPIVRAFRVSLVIVEGIAIIWGLAALFRIHETTEMVSWVLSRLLRRRRRKLI